MALSILWKLSSPTLCGFRWKFRPTLRGLKIWIIEILLLPLQRTYHCPSLRPLTLSHKRLEAFLPNRRSCRTLGRRPRSSIAFPVWLHVQKPFSLLYPLSSTPPKTGPSTISRKLTNLFLLGSLLVKYVPSPSWKSFSLECGSSKEIGRRDILVTTQKAHVLGSPPPLSLTKAGCYIALLGF